MLAIHFLLIFFTEGEGTALCDILTDSYNSWQMRLHGDILVNGVSVSPSRLRDRVAYVRQDNQVRSRRLTLSLSSPLRILHFSFLLT